MKSCLKDEDLMPFGKHKDERMIDVPSKYLYWLNDQEWLGKWPKVKNYIKENLDAISQDVGEEFDDPETYAELHWGR